MNLIKRLTATVSASLDHAVGQIENHDATIEVAIKQTRQALAKTKARLHTLQQQEVALQNKQSQLTQQYQRWSERAKQQANLDQAKALQCLSKRKQCQTELDKIEQAIQQQHSLVEQVSQNASALEQKLSDMTQQHNILRSRQSVADTNRVIQTLNTRTDVNLNDTFERWESSIIENEVISDVDGFESDVTADVLDKTFCDEEEQAQLLAELAELSNKSPTNKGV